MWRNCDLFVPYAAPEVTTLYRAVKYFMPMTAPPTRSAAS